MADPTSLVSLGLDGVGHLLKLKRRREQWKECLQQLSVHVDEAHALLLSKSYPLEDAEIYDEVLSPPINDAIQLLERARKLNSVTAARHIVFQAGHDIEHAERLMARIEGSTAEIESRRAARDARRILKELHVIRAHSENAGRHAASRHRELMISISIYSAAFLCCGEASVTPHDKSSALQSKATSL